MYDQKVTNIAKDCIGRTLQEHLLKSLEDTPFSICIDGGIDKSGTPFWVSISIISLMKQAMNHKPSLLRF